MRGKRRPPSERAVSVAGPLPPCRVCGEDGAGFHYGVNTCEACKGFFSRSLNRKERYQSACSNQCPVTKQKRGKQCAKCRYAKCLSVGMSHNAIKTGRYTYRKRNDDLLEVSHLVENGELPADKLKTEAAWNKLTPTTDNSSPSVLTPTAHLPFGMSKDGKTEQSSTTFSQIPDNDANAATPQGHNRTVISEKQSCNEKHYVNSGQIMMTSSNSVEAATVSHSTRIEPSCPNTLSMQTENETWNNFGLNFDSKDLRDINFPDSPVSEYEGKPILTDAQLRELDRIDIPDRGIGIPSPPTMPKVSRSFQPLTPPLDIDKSERTACTPQNRGYRDDFGYQESRNENSEKEWEEMIQSLVCVHRQYVTDSDYNECSEEYLQRKKDECFHFCQINHNAFHSGLLDWKAQKMEYSDQTSAGLSYHIDKDRRSRKAVEHVECREKDVRQLVKFFKHLPEFKQLSLSTQVNLIRESFGGLSIINFCATLDSERMLFAQEEFMMCQHDLAMWGPKGNHLAETIFQIAEEINVLGLIYAMKVILKLAIVFNPVHAREDERQTVQKLHEKYAQSLLKMYLGNHPELPYELSTGQIGRLISIMQTATGFMRDSMREIPYALNVGSRGRKAYLEIFDGHSQG